ncbi:MAG TPA: hypothetical protein VMZ69_06810 [Saprospiraceae bacterium]|nr:hypothetical protein [Saprospiraceae bacterium]
MKIFTVGLICILCSFSLFSQKEFTVASIAFYNLENLFDTIDSPDTDDLEFTPKGSNLYNSEVYNDKLKNLSKVLSEIGTEFTPDGPALIGVSEIENRDVLEDLVKQPALAKRGYRIIHHDSRDARGVDVALLYQPKYFTPDTTWYYSLITSDKGEEIRYSRDILVSLGKLNNEPIVVTVNHWPSRRGGELAAADSRNKAAAFNRCTLDSLYNAIGVSKSIVMGDLNDDPVNDSVRKYLKAGRSRENLHYNQSFNPMEDFYRKGLGTTAYEDAWSLFDQIILGSGFINDQKGYHFYKSGIFNPEYLKQKIGPYKGYPFRTYANGVYTHGYSDHFPVYVLLVKEKV